MVYAVYCSGWAPVLCTLPNAAVLYQVTHYTLYSDGFPISLYTTESYAWVGEYDTLILLKSRHTYIY